MRCHVNVGHDRRGVQGVAIGSHHHGALTPRGHKRGVCLDDVAQIPMRIGARVCVRMVAVVAVVVVALPWSHGPRVRVQDLPNQTIHNTRRLYRRQ